MSSFFKHADALLVTLLNRKVFNNTVPGKIQFYLSSGIPIIGMIGGEGAKIIKESKAGYVCESGNYIRLSKIISKMIRLDKKILNKMGKNGREYCDKEFSRNKLISRLNEIILEITNKK
tara:strand:- start:138 stop:494 length:357 start_codon:yes stop_codon:yes gene_type:complete